MATEVIVEYVPAEWVITAIASLSAAIVFLFKEIRDLLKGQVETAERLGRLEGHREGVERISDKVLEEVRRLRDDD